MPATVGLVGSRNIDTGLQSTDKKTVTEFAFPNDSKTPNQISIPHEGQFPNPNSYIAGDCYADTVEDTSMLKFFFLALITMYGTYMLQYV